MEDVSNLFEGMEFSVTGRGKEANFVKGFIEQYGGTVASREHKGQSGMIVCPCNPSANKISQAKQYKLNLYTVEWVKQCVEKKSILPPPQSTPCPEEAKTEGKENTKEVKSNVSGKSRLSSPPQYQRKMMVFDEDSTPEKARHSVTPPPLKALCVSIQRLDRRAVSPVPAQKKHSKTDADLLSKYLYSPKDVVEETKLQPSHKNKPQSPPKSLFRRASGLEKPSAAERAASPPAPPRTKVVEHLFPRTHGVLPRASANAPTAQRSNLPDNKTTPEWGSLDSVFPSKCPEPKPAAPTHSDAVSRPQAAARPVTEVKPTVPAVTRLTTCAASQDRPNTQRPTAIPRPKTTMVSRPHSPPKAAADTSTPRIKPQSKPPVPRLAATTKEQEAKNAQEALLSKVMHHPAAKGIDADMAKQLLSQIVDTACPVTFSDISGLENCKQILQEAVILPAKRPELFTGLRKPCSALLLFGPPGNGKTMLAKAIACECGTTFFNISASAITSKWVGDSEKIIRALFGVARALSPSTIFIDEIDSMLQARGSSNEMEGSRRLKTEFLVQMDGAGNDSSAYSVLLMGATNRPYDLDDAVLRRFPKRVLVPLPCAVARRCLITSLLKNENCRFSEADWSHFADITEAYSASDLSQLCKDMALAPIRDLGARALEVKLSEIRPLVLDDAIKCMRSIRPSTTTSQLRQLETWNAEYGSI